MNIVKHLVPGNYGAGRNGKSITGIVLHTMVGTTAGAQARFSDTSSDVSVHYGVSLNGTITQWVEEFNTAYQAGNYQVNLSTIGIEHEDNGDYDGPRTDALYKASAELVADICSRYGIPCDTNHIFLHKDVIDKTAFPGGTACPDALDTTRIINTAAALLQGEEMVDANHADALYRGFALRHATQDELDGAVGVVTTDKLVEDLDQRTASDPRIVKARVWGQRAVDENWPQQMQDMIDKIRSLSTKAGNITQAQVDALASQADALEQSIKKLKG